MTLAELARRPVRTVEPSCTLREAARLMIRYSVGALVITDSTGSNPTGIVTDRDLVVMISEGLDPEQATVDCLVKAPLTTIPVEASLREVTDLMHKHGVRRLPVVDSEGELIGLVSLDDVVVLLGRELADAAAAIEEGLSHERAFAAVRRNEKGDKIEL
jgi:CBS domain-containing protein